MLFHCKYILKQSVVLGIGLGLLSCGLPKPRPNIYHIESDGAVVALILGEGMARSFAHAGVIKALEEEKIPFHLIVGSGMGALVAALYANKKSANDLEWHMMSFQKSTYLNFQILDFLKKRIVVDRLEALPFPILTVATDLKTGKIHYFEKGSIAQAVQSSMAIPGFFKPIRYNQMALVSSEINHGIPVDIAKSRGADLMIAVDLMQGIERYHFRDKEDITLQSYKITSMAHSARQLKLADMVIRPQVSNIDFLDFSKKRQAFLAGYQAAHAVIPQLREILDIKEEE
ncbi:MAG: patatin-like phospholipase family protein [Deltaproteobacteria bacterium]|nr:patatin-like phospholipase family protein [Deltaproteobacteria bacterium]